MIKWIIHWTYGSSTDPINHPTSNRSSNDLVDHPVIQWIIQWSSGSLNWSSYDLTRSSSVPAPERGWFAFNVSCSLDERRERWNTISNEMIRLCQNRPIDQWQPRIGVKDGHLKSKTFVLKSIFKNVYCNIIKLNRIIKIYFNNETKATLKFIINKTY